MIGLCRVCVLQLGQSLNDCEAKLGLDCSCYVGPGVACPCTYCLTDMATTARHVRAAAGLGLRVPPGRCSPKTLLSVSYIGMNVSMISLNTSTHAFCAADRPHLRPLHDGMTGHPIPARTLVPGPARSGGGGPGRDWDEEDRDEEAAAGGDRIVSFAQSCCCVSW